MSESTDTPRELIFVPRGMDLTEPPWKRWHEDMIRLARQTVLSEAKSDGEVYYCLALAEGLGLNPFADEIYFIKSQKPNGRIQPYIGRNGLVKKAADYGAYFTCDTVREHDEFRVLHTSKGPEVTHSYGQEKDRGEIVGAWALIYFDEGSVPGFAYAPLAEYLPEFDQDWKMDKSPWGNQRSAMIEKCAMIACSRQRISIGGVVVDAELDRMGAIDSTAVTVGNGSGEAPGIDLPPEVLEVIERAEKVGHAGYSDRASVEMILGHQNEDFVARWVRRAELDLDEREQKHTDRRDPSTLPVDRDRTLLELEHLRGAPVRDERPAPPPPPLGVD